MSMELFIVGALAICSLLLLWFVSPLKISLAKFFFNKDILHLDDFDDILLIKHPFLGKLLACWVCLSFWISLAIGVIFVVIAQCSLWTPIITFLAYPSLAYLFKMAIKK